MFQLEPGEKYIICRQLEDPVDTNTYYVRAYIRKADGDSLIATVDLTDKTEQRFRGEWYVNQYNVPTEITITTKVFTDSGYTTESNLYGRVEETFLISQRWSHIFGGGGGGGALNYKKIREIVKEEIQNIKPAEKIDLSPVFVAIEEVIKTIKGIKIPEYKEQKIEFPKQKEVDFSEVLNELNRIKGIVAELENTDISQILNLLSEVSNKANLMPELIKLGETLKEFSSERESRNKLSEIKKIFSEINIINKDDKPEVKEKRKFNL